MNIAAVAAVVIGLALLVAGGSKVASGAAWPEQAHGLGAPSWTIAILPWLEITLGALLVVQIARRPLAIAATALLIAFTVLIVRQLAAGRHPPCACFGAWSATPIGIGHVLRNVALIAIAIVASI